MPPETLAAFRDHGKLAATLEADVAGARAVLADLEGVGISLQKVTDDLIEDGLKKFVEPFTKLLKAVARRAREANKAHLNTQSRSLPAALEEAVAERLRQFEADGGTRRLFAGDASFWTGKDEASWLGWLGVAEQQLDAAAQFAALREEARREGFDHILLMGMGGSSLCPEVLRKTFGVIAGSPELHVLDSTDPAQIQATEAKLDLKKTLFIVSSKSGSTLEPNIFKAYFFDRVNLALGNGKAGSRFVAITDPGSALQKEAEADSFRHVYPGLKNVGGRYSALTNFGMVPAAAMGLDVEALLDEAMRMLQACAPGVPAAENPGLVLGTVMGVAAQHGIDKLTITASPGLADLGAWLEQLVAESTGKNGKGIIPVDREQLADAAAYHSDRLFVYVRLDAAPDAKQEAAITSLEAAGHPVVRIGVATRQDLAEEFIRWEIATAVAGAILGINPFDQPDVEASKIATRALTNEYEKTGQLPAEKPFFTDNGISLFADAANASALEKLVAKPSLAAFLEAHVGRAGSSDYFALLAYIEMNAAHEAELQAMRHKVRADRKVATCVGFGPRFLHSTGQAYKGGPNSGVFLQLTCDDAKDVVVPGKGYTFGVVKAAQARGDFQVLAERGRRALRVHMNDVASGLKALRKALGA